ncbi:MAG: Rad52/Rad22 family DNA repair protein [Acidobacteria bacterium]|nr:Rad52/Rad22 family DNA repair protein [Acidobacteriota bacterium]
MNNAATIENEPNAAKSAPRSIQEIIADLSEPAKRRHLKTRSQGGKTLTYLPWYQAVRYLDLYAPGWRYEIRSVAQIGDNLVMTVRVVIPCLEGEIWREASALEKIEDSKRYGDAATNAESAALRRAAAKFGLCLYLYDK